MERFRDLYAKMATTQQRFGSQDRAQAEKQSKPPTGLDRNGLKFIYEPKHCGKISQERKQNDKTEDDMKQYKAEVDKNFDYIVTSNSSRCQTAKRSDGSSFIQTGVETNSGRDSALTYVKTNMQYDYINSSKEELQSYQNTNTGRTSRNTEQNSGRNSKNKLQSEKAALFAEVRAQVNETTASEQITGSECESRPQGDGELEEEEEAHVREISFGGMRNGRHTPTQALQPVLIQHQNAKMQHAQNLTSTFSPRDKCSDESKTIEDYNHYIRLGSNISKQSSQGLNLDLIQECSVFKEGSNKKSRSSLSQKSIQMYGAQRNSEDRDRRSLYETHLLKDALGKSISPYRSATAQSSRSQTKKSQYSNSNKSKLKQKRTESAVSRIRNSIEQKSRKSYDTGTESSHRDASDSNQRIGRIRQRIAARQIGKIQNFTAPSKTPSLTRRPLLNGDLQQYDHPRIVPLRNPTGNSPFIADEDEDSEQQEIEIAIDDQSLPDYVNQDSFGYVHYKLQYQDDSNQRSSPSTYKNNISKLSQFPSDMTKIQSSAGEQSEKPKMESEMSKKIQLNKEKLQLQRTLEAMTKSIMDFQTNYTKDDKSDKRSESGSCSRTKKVKNQSMQVDSVVSTELESKYSKHPESTQRPGRFHSQNPSEIIQSTLRSCGSQSREPAENESSRPPTDQTFRPIDTSKTSESNFQRKYEERSLEAIKQSQLIIERHKKKQEKGESPPKPSAYSPRPTSYTHVVARDVRQEKSAEQLLDERYMQPSEEHPQDRFKYMQSSQEHPKDRSKYMQSPEEQHQQDRSNMWQRQRKRDYSSEARKIIDDQKRIVQLLNIKDQSEGRPPLSPRSNDEMQMTERTSTTRVARPNSYGSIDRNLQMMQHREVQKYVQDYRQSQQHQLMHQSMLSSDNDYNDRSRSQSFNRSMHLNLQQIESTNNYEPQTYRDSSKYDAKSPMITQRSAMTTGIETYCKKNNHRVSKVSDKDLIEIQEKSEQMCRQMSEAKEVRMKLNQSPLVSDLQTQNETLRCSNFKLSQELEYYKQYAKEKQNDLFQANKRNDELECDLNEASNHQLFQMYKQLKTEHFQLQSDHKSKCFSLEQQQLGQMTLNEQYEKLKESQLSLLAMNKQLLVNHQKEVQELQEGLQYYKSELKLKTQKIETYQEVLKSFNGQISEFEDFQQSSQRDMNTLNEQYKLYKELYEKESQQKKLLVAKLRAGKLKVPVSYKYSKERYDDQKRRVQQESDSQDEMSITYLSSEQSESPLKESKTINAKPSKKTEKSKNKVRQNSQSHSIGSPDATFRPHSSRKRKEHQITPKQEKQVYSRDNSEPKLKRERGEKRKKQKQNRSRDQNKVEEPQIKRKSRNREQPEHKTQQQGIREQIERRPQSQGKDTRESKDMSKSRNNNSVRKHETEELGLKSNFAKHGKTITFDTQTEPLTTRADEDVSPQNQIRHHQFVDQQNDSTMLLDSQMNTPFDVQRRSRDQKRSSRSYSRGQSQDYPPSMGGREYQVNVLTHNGGVTYIDQDQSYYNPQHQEYKTEQPRRETNEGQQSSRQQRFGRSNSNSKQFNCYNTASFNGIGQAANFSEPSTITNVRQTEPSNQRRHTSNCFATNETYDLRDETNHFIEEVPYRINHTNEQIYGQQIIPIQEGGHRRRSSSLHRNKVSQQAQEDAELIIKKAVKDMSQKRLKSNRKLVPLSTKDYYLRLKEMQNRLERARENIQENVAKSRERSMSAGSETPNLSKVIYGDNTNMMQLDVPETKQKKGKVVASHGVSKTIVPYKIVGVSQPKKSLQTSLKFKAAQGQANNRKASRSLSASTGNSAIRTAIAGGVKHHPSQIASRDLSSILVSSQNNMRSQ